MIDGLINFIENGSLEVLSRFFIMYLLVLWILFPVWVYLDAKKRYESRYLATIFFIFILPFNLPGLIFYLIIRPEQHDDTAAIQPNGAYEGAVNIPVANFINDDGIVMSLNLSINNSVLKQDQDIKMNVQFDADNDKLKMQTIAPQPVIDTNQENVQLPVQNSSLFSAISNKVKSNMNIIMSVIRNTDVSLESDENSKK